MGWKYRKRLKTIVIEQDRKYRMTLPDNAEITFNALNLYALKEKEKSALKSTQEIKPEPVQMFAYSSLSEPKENNADMIQKMKEAQNKAMKDLL